MTYTIRDFIGSPRNFNHPKKSFDNYQDAMDHVRDLLKNMWPVFSSVKCEFYRSQLAETFQPSRDTYCHFFNTGNKPTWILSQSDNPIETHDTDHLDYWIIMEGPPPPLVDKISKFIDNGYKETDPGLFYSNPGVYFNASQEALKESKHLLKQALKTL